MHHSGCSYVGGRLEINLSDKSDDTMLMENVTGDSEGDLVLPSYIFVYVTFLNIVVFFVGIIGNALVLLTIFRMRDMRNTMNYFLCSLSVADLLVLMICQPSAMLEFYGKDVWYLGDFLCKY